ncbi:MAG: helix-turn-helix domain-containing protein [Paludibacteraceae bacterium]
MLRIKEIMKNKGINTIEMARLLDLSRETVSRQINDSNMTISTLERYAHALSVQISELFEHEHEEKKETVLICPNCKTQIKIRADQ